MTTAVVPQGQVLHQRNTWESLNGEIAGLLIKVSNRVSLFRFDPPNGRIRVFRIQRRLSEKIAFALEFATADDQQ